MNPEHVEIVKQGTHILSLFRKENPELVLDLEEADFAGLDLSWADLSWANLERANLAGAYLSGANLHCASMRSSNLSNAILHGTNLSGAYLGNANLSGAQLIPVNPPEGPFDPEKLVPVDLSGASLSDANLANAELTDANLTNADLAGAYLVGADLRHTNLSESHMANANLSNAKLHQADLSEANLKEANFSGADLSFTNLLGALFDGQTKFSNKTDLSFARISRKWAAIFLDSKQFTKADVASMHVEDPIKEIRMGFGGFSLLVHILAVLSFLVPYVYFIGFCLVSKFFPSSDGETMALIEAFWRCIWTGGKVDTYPNCDWWAFGCFLLLVVYNSLRVFMIWEVKKLELEEQISGVPVELPPGGRLEWAFDFSRQLFWGSLVIVVIHTWRHMLTPVIPY